MVGVALGFCVRVVFAAIGLVSGTDETTTLAPLTLLVVLLGVPPAGVFTFFRAGAVAKHMTHAVPTALLGIPGDTLATPLLQDANMLRKLGVPHIALRKMVSGAIVAAFVAVPLAVLFAVLLAPFGAAITKSAPWIFLAAAVLIAYFSAGRWAAVALLVPFVVVIVALQSLTAKYGVKLSISYFLGIAIGPLIADLFTVIAPQGRAKMMRDKVRTFSLAPDVKGWSGYFPNPLKVMDRIQTRWTLATATISSATFVFSPVAMTVDSINMAGEVYSNQDLIWRDHHLQEPLSRSWSTARSWVLPQSSLQPQGPNTIWLRVVGVPELRPGLGVVEVGTPEAMLASQRHHNWNTRTLFQLNLTLSATLGIMALVVWLPRRKQSLLGWYALVSLCWVLFGSNVLLTETWPFPDSLAMARVNHLAYIGYIASFAVFCWQLIESPLSRRQRQRLGPGRKGARECPRRSRTPCREATCAGQGGTRCRSCTRRTCPRGDQLSPAGG